MVINLCHLPDTQHVLAFMPADSRSDFDDSLMDFKYVPVAGNGGLSLDMVVTRLSHGFKHATGHFTLAPGKASSTLLRC